MIRRTFLLLGTALPLALTSCSRPSGPKRTRIAVIPKGTTHEFWKSVHAGAVKAGKELDVDVIWSMMP